MATQLLTLDGVLASSSLSNATVSNLQAQDGNWAVAISAGTNTSIQASMPTPANTPGTGAGLQTVSVQTRKYANNDNPSATISVGFSGTKVLTSSSFSVTSTSGQINTFTFDFAAIISAGGAADGSNFEVWVDGASVGGSPQKRNSVDIGYIAWTAYYPQVTLSALSWSSGGSVNEGAPNGTSVGYATDGRSAGSTFSLSNTAGGRFTINSSTGQVTVVNSSLLDYEVNTSHNITVRETLSGATNTPRDTVLTVTITNVVGPSITSSNTATVSENATLSKSLTASSGGLPVTWSIVGGEDAAHFEISGSTLRWANNGTKNFEDSHGPSYNVIVRATTSEGFDDEPITVTVTDVAAPDATTWGGALDTHLSYDFDVPEQGNEWLAFSGWTIGGGKMNATSASNTLNNTSGWTPTVGVTYTVSALVKVTSGEVYFSLGGQLSPMTGPLPTETQVSFQLTATSTLSPTIRGNAFTGTVDNYKLTSVASGGGGGNPELIGDEPSGTHVADLNKSTSSTLAIVGGTGSSMFELYNSGGTWGIRTVGTLTGGNKTLIIRDTSVGGVGSGEEREDILTIIIPGTEVTEGRPKVNLSGTYIEKPGKVRIGGEWVEKPWKVRLGGQWVLV